MGDFYWKRHPDGPFATLISIATTYLHPEADDLESLPRLAGRDERPEMRVFKGELRLAITCPGQVPRGEFLRHVQYEDGSAEKFLRQLWRDLYGDEPVEMAGCMPGDAAGKPARSAEAPSEGGDGQARAARRGICHLD